MSLSIPPHLLGPESTGLRAQLVAAASASAPLPFEIPNLARYPVRIAFTKAKGLHLVADRDIAKGEVFLKEAPPAGIVRPEWEAREARFCNSCFDRLTDRRVAEWEAKDPRHNDSTNELCEDCERSSRVRYLDRKVFWRDVPEESESEEEDVSDGLSTLKVSDGAANAGSQKKESAFGKPKKRSADGALSPEDIDDSLFRFFQRCVFGWDAQLNWKFGGPADEDPAPPVITAPQHAFILTCPQTEHISIEPQILTFVSLLDTHLHVVGLDEQKRILEKLLRTAFHNAHEVSDTAAGRSVGMGIYPIASLLNHACGSSANADWAVEAGGPDSGVFVATARRDVKSGEELRIEYGKFGEGDGVTLPVRLEFIMKTWRFACTCPQCASCWVCRDTQLTGLKCSGCGVASYCSREHQKADWPKQHREWCGYLRDLKTRCDDGL
ncbi:hypothetical protein DFJ74DRAFT_656678 [Hyaloraphidium curvatum]|nr:hypothetical protein DFJ74DRAFT_656678 [Hyaloraphidium curvatum]